jgi:hypothetical protein
LTIRETREVKLPSGRTATLRAGKGRDLMRALRAVADNPEPMAVSFALIAELVQIDDKTMVFEDVLAMDLDDVLVLQSEVTGGPKADGNFSPAPASVKAPAAESSVQEQSRAWSTSAFRSES